METTTLPMTWTPQPTEIRSAGKEAGRSVVRDFLDHQWERVHDLKEPLLNIEPFVVEGRMVRVEYNRRESAGALEELRVRLSQPAGAKVKPLGLVSWLESSHYYGDKGRASRTKSYLYFHTSGETIDYCVPGHVVPSEDGPVFRCGSGIYERHQVIFEGPLFRRQVQAWSWSDWDLLVALDAEEASENARHEAAIADIHARRQTHFDGLPEYEAARYNSEVNAPTDRLRGKAVPVPGAIWTNNRDEVAVIVATRADYSRSCGSPVHLAEMLYPDGRRQWVDLDVERWAGMPIWPSIGRAIVLQRELYGRPGHRAAIEGTGHFLGAGRHENPWSFAVRLSDCEFALRLAAALGWTKPASFAQDLDGNLVTEPDIQPGQWVRVPYRRATSWAQVCHVMTYGYPVDDGKTRLYLRDKEGRLYYLLESEVREINPGLAPPPLLAGPIHRGVPQDARLFLHLPEAPCDEPAALTTGRVPRGGGSR